MKITKFLTILTIIHSIILNLNGQDKAIAPSLMTTGTFLGITPPLKDLPSITSEEYRLMEEKARQRLLNPELEHRSYPYASTALPKGPDPVWQKEKGASGGVRASIMNFQAQTSPYFPPDANGVVGPNHYMQTVNCTYAIYNKTGSLIAGPTAINTLFSGLPGGTYNDGDPIVLYDEQAERWFISEFSISGSNDYMLIAVSTSNNPTGTWYKYSFDVADMPDYPKFGIWQDGYYMGTNNPSGNDLYAFERSVMLSGGSSPKMVGFDNPWRPSTIDGFMCVPPVDNDGAFAPEGAPGIFITMNDDAIGGGSDQLWIYELDVNWTTPSSSTFTRIQQINVAAFDSNFGSNWDNIKQLGTTQELDGIPMVIMNVPQYRNFGSYQTIVCCHTVDVDNTDHAGIRWYELRKTDGSWSIRQQGTYAPDSHSRWMGSIMMNGDNEIALGYSVSSSAIYPGIRFCGQSSVAYDLGSSTLDIAEESIQAGLGYQSSYNRWGDYSDLSVDPANDSVFWFTSQYPSSSGSRLTRIASFNIPPAPGAWAGAVSSDWNNSSNWLDGTVPGNSVNLTILGLAPNWPVFTGDLTLGSNCGNIIMEGPSQLTVTGNLTIGGGKNLTVLANGTISIGGNWNDQGTFNPGTGTVEFYGSSPATLTGKTFSSISLNQYSLSTFPAGITALSGASTGPSGDNGAVDITLSFPFYFAGTSYNTVHICTNGWVSLYGSGSTTSDNTLLFTSSDPNTTLAPWFDDLRDDASSTVNYKTEGTSPDRVFTAEWNNVRSYSGNPYVRISFQLKLYETSYIIEFLYGTVVGSNHNPGESASIGTEDATGGPGHFIEATTGSMTTGVINLNSLSNWPAFNYRITPLLDEKFRNLDINKGNATLTVNTDVNVAGNMMINAGAVIDISPNRTIQVLGDTFK